MTRGRFITLEGGEGAGKSTQVRRLVAWLAERGVEAVATREPGGSPGAEAIRTLLVDGATDRWDAITETLLHFAARRDHMRVTVEPALARGAWVVSDRFADSTRAYQGVQGAGSDVVERLYAIAVGDRAPDLTLVLDLPVAEGLRRAAARGGENRYERMGEGFHQKLRTAFLDIAAREPVRCIVVEATAGEDEVARRIAAVVAERLL